MSVVYSLTPRINQVRDWTNAELAELYRVQHALQQANIELEVDRNVTDEGDPWFTFCRYDGEVLVHIARYDGLYHLFSPALPAPLVGSTFSELTASFISRVPEKKEASASSNVIRHPSALLSLLVVTVFFSIDYLTEHGGHADAAPLVPARPPVSRSDGTLRAVISNMLASIGNAETDSLLDSAQLAGQAAVLFIGDSATLYECASSETAATAPEAVAVASADAMWSQTDTLAPPVDASTPSAPAVESGLVVYAHAGVEDAGGQTVAALAISVPVAAVTSASIAAATAQTSAPQAVPVESHAMAVAHLTDEIVVLVSTAGGEVNLAGSFVQLIELAGAGSVTLSGLRGDGSQTIEALGTETVKLGFESGATPIKQTLEIADGSSVTLQSLSVQGETSAGAPAADTAGGSASAVATPPTVDLTIDRTGSHPTAVATPPTVDLTIDSTGSHPNTLTVSDTAVQNVTLNLTIVGSQDLMLQESAQVLNASSLNASGFHGQLTVGVDLTGTHDPTTLVGASNFTVNDNGIVALVNVPDNATIQVATSLESLLATQSAGGSSDHTLSLSLQGAERTLVSIGIVNADGVTTLGLNSGGDASVVNNVAALNDANLQHLEIRGSGSLSIGAIVGVESANDQNITIDASQLNGSLTIDASHIPDVENGGRQITIIGGQGNNVLTNSNATESTTFVAGTQDIFNVADGGQSVTVKGLHAGDTVVVGGGTTSDIVVNATQPPGLSNTYLNSLSLATAAATAAAAAGVAGTHQAVLFDYHNELYVFVDANGNHAFAPGDAIIHLVGMSNAVDLGHVFFSA